MRVWTVQPKAVWDRLREQGSLCVDPGCYRDGYVPWQYEWLAKRMRERIAGCEGGLPWWAYREKPDLRWVRHRMPRGRPQVRIELELGSDEVLEFPLWAWNIVYGGQFLAFTRKQHDAWHAALHKAVPDEDLWPLPEPWRGELEASWLRLFDPNLPRRGYGFPTDAGRSSCREAVFEELRIGRVCAVTAFVGSSDLWSRFEESGRT